MSEDNDMVENEAGLLSSSNNEKDITSPDTPSLPQESMIPSPKDNRSDEKALGSIRGWLKSKTAARVGRGVATGVVAAASLGGGAIKAEAAVAPEAHRQVAGTPDDLIQDGQKLSVQTYEGFPDQPPAKPFGHEPKLPQKPPVIEEGENPHTPEKNPGVDPITLEIRTEGWKNQKEMTNKYKIELTRLLKDEFGVVVNSNDPVGKLEGIVQAYLSIHKTEDEIKLKPVSPPGGNDGGGEDPGDDYYTMAQKKIAALAGSTVHYLGVSMDAIDYAFVNYLRAGVAVIGGGVWFYWDRIYRWYMDNGGFTGIPIRIVNFGRRNIMRGVGKIINGLLKVEKVETDAQNRVLSLRELVFKSYLLPRFRRRFPGIYYNLIPSIVGVVKSSYNFFSSHGVNLGLERASKQDSNFLLKVKDWSIKEQLPFDKRMIPEREFRNKLRFSDEPLSWPEKFNGSNVGALPEGRIGSEPPEGEVDNREKVILGGENPEKQQLIYGQRLAARAKVLRKKLDELSASTTRPARKMITKVSQELEVTERSLNDKNPFLEAESLISNQSFPQGDFFGARFEVDYKTALAPLQLSNLMEQEMVDRSIGGIMLYGISTWRQYDAAETARNNYLDDVKAGVHILEDTLMKMYQAIWQWRISTFHTWTVESKSHLRAQWLSLPGVFYLTNKMAFDKFPVKRNGVMTEVPYADLLDRERTNAKEQMKRDLADAFKSINYPGAEPEAKYAMQYAEYYFIITRQLEVIGKQDLPTPPIEELQRQKEFKEWFDKASQGVGEGVRTTFRP